MKQLYYVIQTLRHAAGSNLFKVCSLGLALAMSVLLFARVAYEQSYDTCFKDYDDIYQVWSVWGTKDKMDDPSEMNMGPVIGTIREQFPDLVGDATCVCRYLAFNPLYYGNTRFDEPKLCADSLFFSTMGIEVLSGNPVQDLQQPNVLYLSESLARRMFGGEDPIGKVVSYNHERDLTVRGTYADLPDNTTLKADAVISFPPSWARTMTNYSWNGGDSFYQYARLQPGVEVEELNGRIQSLINQILPPETSKFTYSAYLAPLRDTYRGYDEVARMKVIMLVLGLSILFIAALNYALLSVSSLSRRAKAVGVHKCNGASGGGVFGMFLLETAVIVLLAVVVMVGLMLGFRDFVEDTASTKLSNLFTWDRIWVPVLTVLLLFVVGGVLPGQLFARIPVTQVFRRYTEGKKGWKRPLLFVQFGGVAFICGLMGMIMLQYQYVMNKDMGFTVDRVAMTSLGNNSEEQSKNFVTFFKSLPYVEDVAGAMGDPLQGYSGTMIDSESGESLFSARFDLITENYVSLMGMTLLKGRMPRGWDEVVINEDLAKRLHWTADNAVGQVVHTMGETPKVVGVVKDFQIGGYYTPQMPYIGFGAQWVNFMATFKLKEPFGDNLVKLQKAVAEAYPDKTIDVQSMPQIRDNMYNPVRVFRNATLVAGLVMFVIMLMGLLGYTADEVQRRSKEIAIRKVNGAEASGILELLGRDIFVVAAPAVLVGVLASVYVNHLWLDMFSTQVPAGWPMYVLTGIVLLALIVACVLWRTWGIANANPVESIKAE